MKVRLVTCTPKASDKQYVSMKGQNCTDNGQNRCLDKLGQYTLSEEEAAFLDPKSDEYDESMAKLIQSLKKGQRAKPMVQPRVVIIDPVADWLATCTLSWTHEDKDYARSFRDRRIADTLYWLGRTAAVLLVVDGIKEPSIDPLIARMSDMVVQFHIGEATLYDCRPHMTLNDEPLQIGQVIDLTAFTSALGLLEPVL